MILRFTRFCFVGKQQAIWSWEARPHHRHRRPDRRPAQPPTSCLQQQPVRVQRTTQRAAPREAPVPSHHRPVRPERRRQRPLPDRSGGKEESWLGMLVLTVVSGVAGFGLFQSGSRLGELKKLNGIFIESRERSHLHRVCNVLFHKYFHAPLHSCRLACVCVCVCCHFETRPPYHTVYGRVSTPWSPILQLHTHTNHPQQPQEYDHEQQH